jgi:endonuclease YncB( thermonuclease family)
MRRAQVLLLSTLCTGTGAAEAYVVVGVTAPDRVVVFYKGIPVAVGLASVEADDNADLRKRCQERLSALTTGKRVELAYSPGFGATVDGSPRVQLSMGSTILNETLVAEGLARFRAGPKPETLDDRVRDAEAKAQKAKLGIWAPPKPATSATTPKPLTTAAPPATPPDRFAKPSTKPSGPFCSELDSQFFYPTGDAAVANVPTQRLISYSDESAAKRAGKRAPATIPPAPAVGEADEAKADAILADAKDLYAQAIAKGNSSERDTLYEKAFAVFSQALPIYGALCEAHPDDEALAEKLRQCMQLRYGSMKQRRYEH